MTGNPGVGPAACRGDVRPTLPADVDCVSIYVCELTATGCLPVRVAAPEGDHENAVAGYLRIPRNSEGLLSFDAALEAGATHRLELVVYRQGQPYAIGQVDGLEARDSIRVRLETVDTWACSGGREDGRPPSPRALHEAVALPDGSALLLGGVQGGSIQAKSVDSGAVLQRAVEVYDPRVDRFRDVEITDTDGQPGFGAVFHRAFFIGEESGRYRIRVVGGFTSNDIAARFDATQGLSVYGAPVLPSRSATLRDSVDLLFDPVARRIELTSIESGNTARAGMNAVSGPSSTGELGVALGLESGGAQSRPTPVLSSAAYAIPLQSPLMKVSLTRFAERFGASASLVGDSIFVWGGNVHQPTTAAVLNTAGELLGTNSSIPGDLAGLPAPTAFHSATPIAGGVLLAGGLRVTPFVSASNGGIGTEAVAPAMTVVVYDSVSRVRGLPVVLEGDWSPTILHATTALADERAVVVGGAIRAPEPAGSSQLWPVGDVRVVGRNDATGAYSATALPGLMTPRWGHTVVPIAGNRILVTGGFRRSDALTLETLDTAEVLTLRRPPPLGVQCVGDFDGGVSDAGSPMADGSSGDSEAADAALPTGESDGFVDSLDAELDGSVEADAMTVASDAAI